MAYSKKAHLRAIATTLAKRAAVVRAVPPSEAKLVKVGENDWMSGLGNMWNAVPGAAKGGLIGGIGGGLAGYGASQFQDKDERRPWRNAMTGALAGGAVGAGAGLAAPAMSQYMQERSIGNRIAEIEGQNSTNDSVVTSAAGKGLSALGPEGIFGSLGLAGYLGHSIAPSAPFNEGWLSKLPSGVKNFLGRVSTPEEVWKLAKRDPKLMSWIQNLPGNKGAATAGGGATATNLKSFQEALKGAYEPGKLSLSGTMQGGIPKLKKEWDWARKYLKADPYRMIGAKGGGLRFGGGAIAAAGIPAGLVALRRFLPNSSDRELIELYRKQKAMGH